MAKLKMSQETDEFGDVYVFSEERLAKLKALANTQFTTMSETVKKSQAALLGIVEWLKSAELNERTFHSESKAYVETLYKIEEEITKTKF